VAVPEERLIDYHPPAGLLDGLALPTPGRRMRAMIGAKGTRRRRRSIVLAVVVLVLLSGGLATGLTLRHLDRQYGPLQPGTFYGPYRDKGFDFHEKDGVRFRLQAAADATGQLITAIRNDGAHSVKITSIETGWATSKIQWSSYRVVNGGNVSGVETPWRSFPAVVPAHGTIRLLLAIHHPSDCRQYADVEEATYDAAHWVHWESLLHSHRTLLDLWPDSSDEGVGIC